MLSRLKAAFIAPCLGVGGADMLMTSLIRHAYNIEWVGVAVERQSDIAMHKWIEYGWDKNVPIHSPNHGQCYNSINYHTSMLEAVNTACKDADIIITWCQDISKCTYMLNKPIVEYAQNTDDFAKKIVDVNEPVTHYKAACSKAAANVFDAKDVKVIYNGIDPSRVTPRNGRDVQRKVWGLTESQKVILYMGRFVDEKHPIDVLMALRDLPSEYVLIFCGHGYGTDNLYKLAQTVAPNRVAFVKNQLHVGDILAAADCFVLPSDFEGHPLALMEAMLAGKPCVYTDFECMRELHEMFGDLGIMVKRGCTPLELSLAVQEATREDDSRFMVTSYARVIVWENFTISRVAAQWEEYLEDCLYDWRRKRRLNEIHPVTKRKILKEPKNV